jgi:transposase
VPFRIALDLKILARWDDGWTIAKIALSEHRSSSTVRGFIQRRIARGHSADSPRRGHPRSYTRREAQLLIRTNRKAPQITFKNAQVEAGTKITRTTMKRVLHSHNLKHWRAKRRPRAHYRGSCQTPCVGFVIRRRGLIQMALF